MTDHEAANLHRRLDAQDKIMLEIRDTITAHIATEAQIRPALDELIALWKGSKILIPMIAGLATAIWAVVVWAKEHIK